MKKGSFWKNYGFLILMLTGIVAGCVVGAIWPAVMEVVDGETIIIDKGATVLEPLGTVFLNLMFCIAVPTVFCSISSSIANMQSARRAGKIMGVTIATFLVTAAIAAVIMYVTVRLIPPVVGDYALVEGEVGGTLGVADMIVNFFTKPDFTELFSRRAILPLIVAAILFGFGIQMAGGAETKTAKLLEDVTNCIMKTFKIITYYAPIGFFGFFAYLIAYHGSDLIGDYGRALAIYYILSFVYMLVFSPIYARFGGGRGAAKVMFSKLFRPAAMSFGTCSSVATIPTNMEVAEETGISKDVSNIVIPLGATMHMDGSAMSAIIKVAFLFGMFGQDFTTGRAILAIIVAVFSSVAMSGIPGGGGTGELVLCSIFFPEHLAVAFPIALALGNLVDPPATMVNSAGDYVISFIVSRYVDGKDWLQKRLSKKWKRILPKRGKRAHVSAGVPHFRAHRRLCLLTPEIFLVFHTFFHSMLLCFLPVLGQFCRIHAEKTGKINKKAQCRKLLWIFLTNRDILLIGEQWPNWKHASPARNFNFFRKRLIYDGRTEFEQVWHLRHHRDRPQSFLRDALRRRDEARSGRL